ncbi:unnamed protein product [Bathycoccus prasinos]
MSLRRAANNNNNNNIIFNNISTRRERRRIVRDFLSPSMMLFSFSFLLSLFFFFPWCWLSKNTRGESTRSTTLRADGNHHGLLVAVVTTTKDASGRRFEQWVRYHEQVGIGLFYVFVDDRTKKYDAFSQNVKLFSESEMESIRSKLLCNKEQWLVPWIRKRGCNAELFVKQSQNVEMAIEMATEDNVDWIAHIDTDELLFPAGVANLDIRELLREYQPRDIDGIVLPNYEAVPETKGGVQDPFVDATLFKRNYEHADKKTWKKLGGVVITLKRCAQVQISANIKFSSSRQRFNEVTHSEAKILHYPYMNLDESIKRLRNCCPRDVTSSLDAEKINQTFLLDFDRQAFVALVLNGEGEDEESERLEGRRRRAEAWYNERIVFEDVNETAALVHSGVFDRIYAPSLLLKKLSQK